MYLLQDIQQQTHDLACTLRQYQLRYGKLPVTLLASSLLVRLLTDGSLDYGITDAPLSQRTPSLLAYIRQQSEQLIHDQRYGLGSNYHYLIASLTQFLGERELLLDQLTPDLVKSYETWLFHTCGISRNTSSNYMRQLRAIYNRAVAQGIVADQHPFRQVYTGISRTPHRALSLDQIRAIKRLDLSSFPQLSLARDLFMFSFYTQGMAFVDMAFLRTEAITGGKLTYHRQKSRQTITLRWEPEMAQLVERIWQQASASPLCRHSSTVRTASPFLLPILGSGSPSELYHQYRMASHQCNELLHRLESHLELPIPLTMYVARHSWATGAYRSNIPVETISQALGHSQGNEHITRIYLDTIEQPDADRQKRKIIEKVS